MQFSHTKPRSLNKAAMPKEALCASHMHWCRQQRVQRARPVLQPWAQAFRAAVGQRVVRSARALIIPGPVHKPVLYCQELLPPSACTLDAGCSQLS